MRVPRGGLSLLERVEWRGARTSSGLEPAQRRGACLVPDTIEEHVARDHVVSAFGDRGSIAPPKTSIPSRSQGSSTSRWNVRATVVLPELDVRLRRTTRPPMRGR